MKNYINFRNHHMSYQSNKIMNNLAKKNMDDNNPDNDYILNIIKKQTGMPQIKAEILFDSGADFSIISKKEIDFDKKTYLNEDGKVCFDSNNMILEIMTNKQFLIEGELDIDYENTDVEIDTPFSVMTNKPRNSLFNILEKTNNKISSKKGKDFHYFYDYFYNNDSDNKKAFDFTNSSLCKDNSDKIMYYILREDKNLPAYLDFITHNWEKYREREPDTTLLEHFFINNCFYIYNSLKNTNFLNNSIEQEAELLINNINISPNCFFNSSFVNLIEKDYIVSNTSKDKKKIKRNSL